MKRHKYSLAILFGLLVGSLSGLYFADAVVGISVGVIITFGATWLTSLQFDDAGILLGGTKRTANEALLAIVGKHGYDALTNRHNHWPGSKIVVVTTLSLFGRVFVAFSFLAIVTGYAVYYTGIVVYNILAIPYRFVALMCQNWKFRNIVASSLAQTVWVVLAGYCYYWFMFGVVYGPFPGYVVLPGFVYSIFGFIALVVAGLFFVLGVAFLLICLGLSITEEDNIDEIAWKLTTGGDETPIGTFYLCRPIFVETRFEGRAFAVFCFAFFAPVFNLLIIPVVNALIFCVWAPIYLASKKTGMAAFASASLSACHLAICFACGWGSYANPGHIMSLLAFACVGFWAGSKIHGHVFEFKAPKARFVPLMN